MKKKILFFILFVILLLIAILLIRTVLYKSKQVRVEKVEVIDVNDAAIHNLATAIRIKTVSPENSADFDSSEFRKFSDFLTTTYPLTDSVLEKKVINSFSFLYKWNGTNPVLKPIVLMAHLDVVPSALEDSSMWTHQPFEGNIVHDTLWGRGAIDDKIGIVGIMEAVELLLNDGFIPQRTIYLAFGHDEEIGGRGGAVAIAEYLKSQKVEAEFVLDEGGSIVQRMVPGIEKDVALIGVSEKGFVSLELSIDLEGGHSSMPKDETAIDVIAKAISTLRANPFPSSISPALEGFIDDLGPEMPFLNRLVFANRFLFNSIILKIYEGSAAGNALVRTTIVPTIFNSGIKDNIIPQSAKATVNFRILPGSTSDDIIKHVKALLKDDRIIIRKNEFHSEASRTSSTKSEGYRALNTTILQTFPQVLTAPNIVIGATDARHFESISTAVYRFLPIYINESNIKSFHGLNERIATKDIKTAVRFYTQLIKNCNKLGQ